MKIISHKFIDIDIHRLINNNFGNEISYHLQFSSKVVDIGFLNYQMFSSNINFNVYIKIDRYENN